MRYRTLCATLAFTIACTAVGMESAHAQGQDATSVAEQLRSGIEAASIEGDDAAMKEMLALGERALAAFPENALIHHYAAYALYRSAMAEFETDHYAAIETLSRSQELFERSIDLEPIAESHALMSSVVGAQIMSDQDGMAAAPVIAEHLYRAAALGPGNPRVKLMEGLNAFHTPAAYGGGIGLAIDHIEVALSLFEEDAPRPSFPAWGHAEAYAWLGQAHAQLGHAQEARAAYERALELEPGYAWVRDDLLPGLDGDH